MVGMNEDIYDDVEDEAGDDGDRDDDDMASDDHDDDGKKIEDNDPTFTELDVAHDGYLPPVDGWENFGMAIGRNTNLKRISLDNHRPVYIAGVYRGLPPREGLLHFLRGFTMNRSIKKMTLWDWNLSDEELCNRLALFFNNNHEFECLEVVERGMQMDAWSLCAILRRFHSLKEFELTYDYDYTGEICSVDGVIEALIGHTALKKLRVSGNLQIHLGCAALATLLQNPRSELTALAISFIEHVGDEGAGTFANGLSGNTSLKTLDMSGLRGVTQIGWQAIFASLPTCKVEKIKIGFTDMNDACLQTLSNALIRSTSLKTLKFSRHDLSRHGITLAGWTDLFQILRHPNQPLEELHLSNNSVTDEILEALTNTLTINTRLRYLDLSYNSSVTDAGWVAFSTVLRNPNTALEELLLESNINAEVMISFANSLANNNKLRVLIPLTWILVLTCHAYMAMPSPRRFPACCATIPAY